MEIKKLQQLIDESDNIVFFGGAGVSTESGIKDFRGKNGLYNENKEDINPEYMLSSRCLYKEPEKFYDYYRKNMNCLDIKPNVTHYYLTKLEEQGKLKAIVTQNIDGLHQKAGSKNVLEIHGSIMKNYCCKCGKEYDSNYIFESTGVPRCSCKGLIRPNVVLYGEMLPVSFSIARNYIYDAELLIVAGTSLTVEPACSLLKVFNGKNLVIINNTKTKYDDDADLVINKPLGEVFKKLK